MGSILKIFTLTTLAWTVLAQELNSPATNEPNVPVTFTKTCGADLVLDDFSVERDWVAPTGEAKRLNALDGDWGIYGGNFTIDTTAKTMTVTPARGSTVYQPDVFNPNTVPTFQWFYAQFSNQTQIFDKACANLTPFSAIQFDAIAPAGFDFNITFTQRQKGNCSIRTFDSEYRLFSSYYKTPGTKQTILLPFSDFSKDLSGATFDYSWNKDITWINMAGANQGDSIVLSNFIMKGSPCNQGNGNGGGQQNGQGGGKSATATATAKASATATAQAGSNAGFANEGALSVVAAAAAVALAAAL